MGSDGGSRGTIHPDGFGLRDPTQWEFLTVSDITIGIRDCDGHHSLMRMGITDAAQQILHHEQGGEGPTLFL